MTQREFSDALIGLLEESAAAGIVATGITVYWRPNEPGKVHCVEMSSAIHGARVRHHRQDQVFSCAKCGARWRE